MTNALRMIDWQSIIRKRAAVLKRRHQHARVAFRRYFNVSEFLQLNENTGCFLRPEIWPHSWNNGIVERWNSGFSKDIIHLKLYVHSAFGGPFTQYCSIPRPIFPIFQYSTIPIGAKPLTCKTLGFWILFIVICLVTFLGDRARGAVYSSKTK